MSEAEPTFVTFPLLIRENVIVRIGNLPHDLTEEEAERICRVVRAFAVGTKETQAISSAAAGVNPSDGANHG